MNPKRAVFFDRDGTLNIERGYIDDLANLELYPGTAKAVKQLNEAGVLTVLTTNQTGAARGYYPESHIWALNTKILTLLWEEAGAWLDAIYYSPYWEKAEQPEYREHPESRKPETGMIKAAHEAFPSLDISACYVLGDKATDVSFAHNAGCKGVLLKTGYGQQVLDGSYQALVNPPWQVADSVVEAIDLILKDAAISVS